MRLDKLKLPGWSNLCYWSLDLLEKSWNILYKKNSQRPLGTPKIFLWKQHVLVSSHDFPLLSVVRMVGTLKESNVWCFDSVLMFSLPWCQIPIQRFQSPGNSTAFFSSCQSSCKPSPDSKPRKKGQIDSKPSCLNHSEPPPNVEKKDSKHIQIINFRRFLYQERHLTRDKSLLPCDCPVSNHPAGAPGCTQSLENPKASRFYHFTGENKGSRIARTRRITRRRTRRRRQSMIWIVEDKKVNVASEWLW